MAGEYFTLTPGADLAADQRGDDALSTCLESPTLETPLEILGRPVLTARVRTDRQQVNLIARLVDVHPDGTSALIARGALNLCHRNGSAEPQPMEPGVAAQLDLRLDETGYRVKAGHRLRLAVSTAYFPMVLPSPEPVIAVIEEGAVLSLPQPGDIQDIAIAEPPEETLLAYPQLAEGGSSRTITHDLDTGRVRYTIQEDSGLSEVPRNAMQTRETRNETWEIDPADPLSVTGVLRFTTLRQRGAWQARTEANIRFTATSTTWDVEADQIAWSGYQEISRRDWKFSVPRDHM